MWNLFLCFCFISSQVLFTENIEEDIELACRIGTVSESLIDESPDRHRLRSRLCLQLVFLTFFKGLASSMLPLFPELYHSAMMAGDLESAMMCQFNGLKVEFWTAAVDLASVSNHFVRFIKQAVRMPQIYSFSRFRHAQELICVSCSLSVVVRPSTSITHLSTVPCHF